MTNPNNRLKLILIGNQEVGKTCLFQQYTENVYDENPISTIGVDFRHCEVNINPNETIYITLWDTAGQERFKSITKNYYKGAQGFIIIYDITNLKSFEDTKHWIKSIRETAKESIKIMIVGNKLDKADRRVITTEQGKQFAEENNCFFEEASAKNNINIDKALITITQEVFNEEKVRRGKEEEERKRLNSSSIIPQKKKCC